MNIKKYTKNWYRLRSAKEIIVNIYISCIKKDIILILNIGKVGSTSVYKTLKKQSSSHCLHIHRISEIGMKKQIDFHLKYEKNNIPPHIMLVKFFRNKILNHNRKLDLIVIIRNPIDRFISYIFQHHAKFKIQPFFSTECENYKKAIEIINQKILEEKAWDEFDEWFKEEVFETFDIDIYKQEYNEEKGYNIYKNGNKSLLLLKMERLNNDFASASKIFLKLEQEIVLEPHNIGEEKEYKEEYRIVKTNLKFERKIIENFINSKYSKHFYAKQEAEVFRKWSK
jgi:hypothetical protein